MANYSAIKAAVNAYIKANGRKEITGSILNAVLNATIDSLGRYFQFAGGAMPTDDPGTPDQNVCYLATEPGLYVHFNNIRILNEEVALLFWDGEWRKNSILMGIREVDANVDNTSGTPSVDVSYSQGRLVLSFHNLKGEPGDTGEPAGFGTIAADITGGAGTPGVSVETSGENAAKNILFHFTNLKGDPGVSSVIATIDNTSGTPSCRVSLEDGVLTLAFSGLKGLKGDTGVSADYPITIYNGLDSDATDQALSAAQGKVLDGKIRILQEEVNGSQKNYSEGHYLKQDGTIGDYALWGITDFIPYTPGNSVTWKFDSEFHNYYLGFFNENKEYISGSEYSPQFTPGVGGRLITAESISQYARNAAYVRASFNLGYADAEVMVGDTIAWRPTDGQPSLQEQIDSISNHVTELDDEIDSATENSIQSIPQTLSPVQKENARENVGVRDTLLGVKKNYISDAIITQGNIYEEDGWCVTDFIPVNEGDEIVWNFGGGAGDSGRTLSLYDADKNYSNYYSSNGYTDERDVAIAAGSTFKFIRATFKKTLGDGTPNLTPVVINGVPFQYKDNVTSFFDYVKENLDDEKRWKPLCIPGLINSDYDSAGNLKDDDYFNPRRVTTSSVVTPPFPGAIIRFRFNRDVPYVVSVFFYTGDSAGTKAYDSVIGRMMDGDIRRISESVRCLRPAFRASDSATGYSVEIAAETIKSWFEDGSLALEYYDNSPDGVVERNAGIMPNLSALKRVLIYTSMPDNGMDSMPVLGHITDLHGDAPRFKNFLDFCDKAGVDVAINSGDSVLYQKRDGSKFVPAIAKEHNTPVIFAIGNHESLPTGNLTLFDDNIAELADEYEYLASAGIETTKCYYYKDFPGKKLRVIALNQYEDGVYQLRLGQAQVSWFITTLLSTPAGYGIVVTYHAPEDRVEAESPYDVFRQPAPNGASSHPDGYFVDKRVIEMIIDAFISRESVSFSYEDHSATYNGTSDLTTEIVNVNADFSGVDLTTEFICYVAGHKHEDWIGFFSNSENRQLYLGITCGNALYGDSSNPAWSNQSDLPRGGVGVSQDAFCIYAIDRLNGNVKVMRVGASVTQMMVKREMMVIPYKD